MKYSTLVYTHLKWVLNFLVYYPFYRLHHSQVKKIGEEQSMCHCESTPGSEEGVDCAECECKIGGGEEIREVGCDKVFHRDCPVCTESVGPRRAISKLGAEVLLFKFGSIRTDDRDKWWLR
ncbi:uncharacterized protein LOC133287165 [Gastrolobium bilobum]|uniref:uncharacterized protein LOC133287165 n=1 Tax=Gastrolobium bilobum TaxID=150636 RepID=UPI002AAF8A69|nr:uncharacterized protein LOC133287165 [Gastrolobium bilobum]